jgi:spermidine synthase
VHDSAIDLAKGITQSRGQWLSEALDEGFKYSILTNTVLSQVTSKFQFVEVHQTDSFGRVLVLDGSLNVSEKDEFFYHENLVHVPACQDPSLH